MKSFGRYKFQPRRVKWNKTTRYLTAAHAENRLMKSIRAHSLRKFTAVMIFAIVVHIANINVQWTSSSLNLGTG